jgi:hypothetical protein
MIIGHDRKLFAKILPRTTGIPSDEFLWNYILRFFIVKCVDTLNIWSEPKKSTETVHKDLCMYKL